MKDITAFSMDYWENKKVNCARSTACGILDFYNFTEASKILYNTFTTFGGGIGEGTICGSLIGALGALNLILKTRGLTDDQISEKTKNIKSFFKEEFNTLECRFILDEFRTENGKIDTTNPERRNKCTKTVKTAIRAVQQIIGNLALISHQDVTRSC